MRNGRVQVAVAMALTAVAGFVDATGYLALFHVYTANMSGNSVAIGMDASRGDWRGAAWRALPVAAFFAGLVLASVMIELARVRGARRSVSLALGVEVACLLAFVRLAPTIDLAQPARTGAVSLLVALAAIAMGAQNASLRDAGVLDVYTTHVTGTLTTLARDAARFFFERRVRLPHLLLLASLWAVYVLGAAGGGLASMRGGGLRAMWIPIGIVAAILLLDLVAPLAGTRQRGHGGCTETSERSL